MSSFEVVRRVILRWFWYTVYGTVVHKLLVRLLYFPSIGRMCLAEGPNRRWYDRIDDTVILGALPFKSQAKKVCPQTHTHYTYLIISVQEVFELESTATFSCFIFQLVEVENVRAVISFNEEYELNYFTNSKKVSLLYTTPMNS